MPQDWDEGQEDWNIQARFCKCRVFGCSAKRRDKGADVLGRVQRVGGCASWPSTRWARGCGERERGKCARQVQLWGDRERRQGSEDSAEGVVVRGDGRVEHE